MRNSFDGRVRAADVFAWRVYDGRAVRGAYRVAMFIDVPGFYAPSWEMTAVMDDFGNLVRTGVPS